LQNHIPPTPAATRFSPALFALRKTGFSSACFCPALLCLALLFAGPPLLALGAAKAEGAPQAQKTQPPNAKNEVRHHALSLIGKPKYAADFKHFNYVNPDAPKGGVVRMSENGGFDTLNILANKGHLGSGLGFVYDSLMDQSLDQPSTSYCLLCEWVSYPADFSSVTFKLRDGAKWHDGKPVSVEDVIYSFRQLTKNKPGYRFYYKNVSSAEKTGERLVTFRFNVKNNREMPQIMGDFPVVPKHFWTGNNAKGEVRTPAKSSLEAPLGSGPYRISNVIRGSKITYERVRDYWARDLPINRGRYNFDKISYTYFKDESVALEAFKSGQIDYRAENSSKRWANAYNFPAYRQKKIVKKEIELQTSEAMQAFVMNTRRKKFQDANVRKAFILAFNFEWANRNLFFGQYRRTSSFFEGTELASSGLPKGKELEILNEVRDMVPAEVFTTEYKLPNNSNPRQYRKNLIKARRLLRKAGWKVADGMCIHTDTGERLKVTFLLLQDSFKRVVMPYVRDLKKLGIEANVRKVDSAQYVRRLRSFDFDIIIGSFRQSQSPGNEQRDYWSSAAANKKGSRNLIGIKNKAIDKLIDKVIFAKDRAELVAASRALDRVLLWNHYVVPQWYSPYERIAFWKKFGSPKITPSQDIGFLKSWWFDKSAARILSASRS